MKKVFFILAIHNHQPVGNFDFVLADAYERAYWPFLKLLEKYPSIKVCLHYSGFLWTWLSKERPQMIDLCKTLLERGQIELLSGGFYEPILPIIPDHDKIGQMEMMGDFIYKKFGVKPHGVWLPERVWEPSIPKFINTAGYEFVIVDDFHFLASGLEEKDLHGYYLTDDQGKIVKVFPGSKNLRYLIPFKSAQDTLEYLSQIRDIEQGDLALMADDGEKFGIWPGTYKWVYEHSWLEQFFCLIEKNLDWLKMCTLSEYISEHAPLGQIYLPTASYAEMEEWSLPYNSQKTYHYLLKKISKDGFSKDCNRFIRGGLWRNFLCKYKEGNILYNRMLQISQKIADIKTAIKNKGGAELPQWLICAQDELWKGQCNDAYWHGLFGGLYLPHLRAALYKHLIQADNLIESYNYPDEKWINCMMLDMDQDGKDEIKISTDKYCLFIDPDSSGNIYEWDFRPKCINVINTLIRRPEGYHQNIVQLANKENTAEKKEIKSIHDIQTLREDGLEKLLIYDKYLRNSLIDHFFHPAVTFQDFSSLKYEEIGDFIGKPYQSTISKNNQYIEIGLSRSATIDSIYRLTLNKTLAITPGETLIKINYNLINEDNSFIDTILGIEFNFNLLSGYSNDHYFLVDDAKPSEPYLASKGEIKNINKVCIVDKISGIEIGLMPSEDMDLWRFPIETASNSEGGFEKVFQGSVLLFRTPIKLEARQKKTLMLDCWIKEV